MSKITPPRIKLASLKRNNQGQFLILWGTTEKEIPPRLVDNISDKTEVDYWYDQEYAGWNITKTNIPESPRTKPEGRHVIYITPGVKHPYLKLFCQTLEEKFNEAGVIFEVLDCNWNNSMVSENIQIAIDKKPDLILLNPENLEMSSSWYKQINTAQIPVIGTNLLASNEGHKYLLSWTGPDDWGQSRELARVMADKMGKRGNYTILEHYKGTSSYLARKWGVITELKRYAPEMKFLDSALGLDMDIATGAMKKWLTTYNHDLGGVFCADDGIVLDAITEIAKQHNRDDICFVAIGSSISGIQSVLDKKIYACAYQSPIIDSECAFRTAVEWFEGIPIDPIRYLPTHIITLKDAAEFLHQRHTASSLDLTHLFNYIKSFDWKGSYNFFENLYRNLLTHKVIPSEVFQGICLEILIGIIFILKNEGISSEETLGSYENLAKHLMKDQDISSVLDWLNNQSLHAISALLRKLNKKTPIQEIIDYVDANYTEPMSLKSLSYQFSISQAYLGQIFKKELGIKFNDYINTKRVDEAKKLLLCKNRTISKVALSLGYADPAYFYKIFKKQTGLSASEFVKQNQTM